MYNKASHDIASGNIMAYFIEIFYLVFFLFFLTASVPIKPPDTNSRAIHIIMPLLQPRSDAIE